jgi:hypothetical protein
MPPSKCPDHSARGDCGAILTYVRRKSFWLYFLPQYPFGKPIRLLRYQTARKVLQQQAILRAPLRIF